METLELQKNLKLFYDYYIEKLKNYNSLIFAPDMKNDCSLKINRTVSNDLLKDNAISNFQAQQPLNFDDIESLKKKIVNCVDCEYHQTRNKAALGTGAQNPIVMFIGKAPKSDGDKIGHAFAGTVADTIKAILEKVLFIDMKQVYLTNAVKCKPSKSAISKKNIDICKKYLIAEILLIKPKIICAMGNEAIYALLGEQLKDESGIMQNHGTIYHYNDIPVLLTLNPSSFLEHSDPEQKKKRIVFEDMKKLKILIDKIKGAK
ncbi:MAG TPA: uracil-DNA glycosylase [bacterium]|nr:uracil-DNA glycosylase [bacterium]